LDNENLITNIRQKNLIEEAIKDLKNAKNSLNLEMPIDIIAISIKEILEDLGKITGEEVSEDIINEIFSKFCLGK
jgi:tRNA modification GTPase